MSVEAVTWALNKAPQVPPSCMAVLIGLANHAHPNGRGAFPSQERLAHYSRKSSRSVRNDLASLEGLGLIRRGDQRHTAFIPEDRRPVVWDLAVERRREIPSRSTRLLCRSLVGPQRLASLWITGRKLTSGRSETGRKHRA